MNSSIRGSKLVHFVPQIQETYAHKSSNTPLSVMTGSLLSQECDKMAPTIFNLKICLKTCYSFLGGNGCLLHRIDVCCFFVCAGGCPTFAEKSAKARYHKGLGTRQFGEKDLGRFRKI